MGLSVAARNYMLDQLGANKALYVSLNSGDPGSTGANELAGITRIAVTWAAANNGSKAKSGTLTLTVPAGSTVAAFSLWDSLSGGAFQGGDFCRDGSNNPIVETFGGAGTYTLTTLSLSD